MDTVGVVGEREYLNDEGCVEIEFEDSRSSFGSFMYCKSPSHSASTKKTTSCQGCDTPKSKSNGILHQPVRRRLQFSSHDENSSDSCRSDYSFHQLLQQKYKAEPQPLPPAPVPVQHMGEICKGAGDKENDHRSCRNVDLGEEPKSAIKQTLQQSAILQEKVGGTRKIAQLVVWTKKPGVKEPTKEKEVAPAKISVSEPLNSSEGNLFFVQCPTRGPTDAAKKVKVQKRLSKSPTTEKPKRKKKRSAAQSSSSGRAYRAYLHTCLEKQRQQLRVGTDFKVEKLFQPEQGVALPGEIPPPSENLTCSVAATEASNVPHPPHHPPVARPTSNSGTNANCAEVPIERFIALPDPPATKDSLDKSSVGVVTSSSSGGSGEFTIFDLPDKFTVTTDCANEFDLLIQNVVHEEMVDGDDEDDLMGYKFDRLNKRMKMSNTSSISSNEERMSMDESGKPRCTYTELIEKALTESGGLTVSEIYTWISDRYPFFKPDDDRWKNSVRHNLSINPYFKKGEKARNGAGHLWTISEESKGLRPSMVSWDERRKCPYDPSEIIMPMESETDRAVANILGQYLSECRASKEASEVKKGGNKRSTVVNENDDVDNSSVAAVAEPAAQPESTLPQQDVSPAQSNESGVTCNTAEVHDLGSFSLNELNSGQFTVDLGGITIPEGGSINFEELVNAGRLIYIQTDPDANKENDSTQAVILNECLLPELSALTNNSSTQDDNRFSSLYSDPMSLDFNFGKGDSLASISFANDMSHLSCTAPAYTLGSVGSCQDILTSGQLVPQSETSSEQHQQNHQDLTVLDQVIPMSYEEVVSGGGGSDLTECLPPLSAAALYESKELGISYTYQTEQSNQDIL